MKQEEETHSTREVAQVNGIYICISTIVQNSNSFVFETLKFTCPWNFE